MAPTTLIVFLVVSSMYVISQVSSSTMMTSDCCLSTKDREIPYNNVICYTQQTVAQSCNIDAIVFVTRKNRHLCAPPNSAWVKRLMIRLDKNKPQFKKECGR